MRPRWKLVALFYGMAFGWVSLIALALFALGYRDFGTGMQQLGALAVAFLYMPAPLVAALIVERVAGDKHLIRYTFQGFGRKLLRLVGFSVITIAIWFLVDIGLVWLLGNVLHVPGVGTLASNTQEIVANLTALAGPKAMTPEAVAQTPAPAVMILIAILAGAVAGFSINGLFAFGEEYGWRGWLMNELRPLGVVKANIVTGTLWGLWHTPLIVLGFNYGRYNLVGPLLMAILCIPLSFLLWRAREFTGSLLAPAIMHGSMNASAGFFLFLVGGANEAVRAPVGLLGAAGFALVALGAYAVTRGRLRDTVDPSVAPPELAGRSNPPGTALESAA
jgi:membrane protease YdiL (CAAX protease family)